MVDPKQQAQLVGMLQMAVKLDQNKQYQDAEKIYQLVLKNFPNLAEAHKAYGQHFVVRKNYKLALEHMSTALKLDAENNNYKLILANINNSLDEPEIAHELYTQILQSDPIFFVARQYLIISLIRDCKFDEARKYLSEETDPHQIATLHTLKALMDFLDGNMQTILNYPDTCNIIFEDRKNVGLEFFRKGNMISVYSIYLCKVAYWWENNPEDYQGAATKELYIFGDSHCLSSAFQVIGDYKLIPKLLFGAKAYHLGKDGLASKQEAFTKMLETCTDKDHAVFTFGEIDCRIDEGIYLKQKDASDEAREVAVSKLVDEYVDFVLKHAQNKFERISFCNIPAPQKGLCKAKGFNPMENKKYPDITRLFNETLQKRAVADGFDIIDVYAKTADADGWGTREHMLDQVHLKPDVVTELLR